MNVRLLPACIVAMASISASPAWANAPLAVPPSAGLETHQPTMGAAPLGVAHLPVPALPPQPGDASPASVAAAGAPAYPPEYQRARVAWIDECAGRYLSDNRKENGGILGGILGAVVGGVAGNRIAGRGSRLGGTLLGAGAGGLAGAVVGSAIDRGSRSKAENEAVDWCEDYLTRNTPAMPAYGYPYPASPYPMGGYPMAYSYGPPMMMQPVMVPVQRCHEHEVVERPLYRSVPAREVIRDKRLRMQPTKSVKYIKSAN